MYTCHAPKYIALLASGTRGDVQPYIALASGLRARGFDARVVTHRQFAPFVTAYSVPWVALADGPNALLSQPTYQHALSLEGGAMRGIASSLRFLIAARPAMTAMLESAWHACRHADSLIIGLPTAWGAHIAQALNVPYAWALLQPLGRTGSFASPLMPIQVPPIAALRRATHTLSDTALWLPWRSLLHRWRTKTLGLPPLPFTGPPGPATDPNALALYGYSPHLAPPPSDWGQKRHVCGAWLPGVVPDWRPDPSLEQWCSRTPVYIGFGSMGREEATTLAHMAQSAIAPLGISAIVQAGTQCALVDAHSIQEQTYTELPHQWLFPRMAAVVHHGGASTTASAATAGVPQVIVPHAVDQFFWGERAMACGIAPPPLPRRRLSAQTLSAAIAAALSASLVHRADTLGRIMRQEAGVERAIDALVPIVS